MHMICIVVVIGMSRTLAKNMPNAVAEPPKISVPLPPHGRDDLQRVGRPHLEEPATEIGADQHTPSGNIETAGIVISVRERPRKRPSGRRRSSERSQSADPFGDGATTRPVIADVVPLLGRGPFSEPPLGTPARAPVADEALERGGSGLVLLDQVGGSSVISKALCSNVRTQMRLRVRERS
jgi:hypothetical protein